MANKKDFSYLIGTMVNGKEMLEHVPQKGYMNKFKYRCSCGHISVALLQSIQKGTRCTYCGYKGPRPNRRLRPYEAVYNTFKQRTKHLVQITYEDFFEIIKNQKCHYCFQNLKMSKFNIANTNGSHSCLDRKDCDYGYTKENIVPCCPKCNYGKGKWYTYKEWVVVGQAMSDLYKQLELKELNKRNNGK